MEHIIRRTSDARIIPSALPYKLQEVVHAGEDIVHEDDRIKVLVLRVPEVVQRHERSIAHLREILYPVVERTPRAHRGADLDPQPH